MVGGAVPLIVNIFMAALAGIGFHEELAGNFFAPVDLRGAREEWAAGAIAFAIHRERWELRILNARVPVPAGFAEITSRRRENGQNCEHGYDAQSSVAREPSTSCVLKIRFSSRAHARREDQSRSKKA